MESILLVDDDPAIADLIESFIHDIGYRLERAADGEAGLRAALDNSPSLIILDWRLPKLEGIEVCRKLREKNKSVPILMLTSRKDEIDLVVGLEIGADDYLTKPFSLRELVARVRALLRRTRADVHEPAGEGEDECVRGDLMIQVAERKVKLSGRVIELSAKEFDLLLFLAQNPGRTFTREQLITEVWGYNAGYENVVTTYINRIRTKLEPGTEEPFYVRTLRGVGYRFASLEELGERKR